MPVENTLLSTILVSEIHGIIFMGCNTNYMECGIWGSIYWNRAVLKAVGGHGIGNRRKFDYAWNL